MKTSDKIIGEVNRLLNTEMSATVRYRKTRSSVPAKSMVKARLDILSPLREAARLRDIDLLLDIEWAFMRLELEHIAHARKNISSLSAGLQQIEAAVTMLGYVRDPDKYREIASYYTLSQDLVRHLNLPKDAAHKFFGSHRTRLDNMETGPLEEEQTVLLNVRRANVRLAWELYIDLQRRALGASEVHEPMPACYRPIPATWNVRDPARLYAPERKLRPAA